jgi:hypothetical protein
MLLYSFLAVVHTLAGAVWLGALAYSFFLLHPRAHVYFQKEPDFEAFIATVSHGARWKVLGGLGVIALSGLALCMARWPTPLSVAWLALVGAKVAVWVAALALFLHTSWRLWPARVLALEAEIPHFQRAFRRVAVAMMILAVLGMTLGILGHTWLPGSGPSASTPTTAADGS